MKKTIIAMMLLASTLQVEAQNKTAELFGMDKVRLEDSRFKDNFKRDSTWMMSIAANRLLHSFRNTAGVFSSKEGGYMTMKKLGGWESLDCDLRGHTTGHLLSALAVLYAQTQSEAVKVKADSIVNGLKEVQDCYGTGYLSAFGEGLINRNLQGKSVWAPWYTLHKIVQGLIDQYVLCGNQTALDAAIGMGNWAYNKLREISEEDRQRMLRNEFGGFNDTMYQLYAITNDERFMWLARYFYHNDKIDPLRGGKAELGTNHANTFIPKLMGEVRNYNLTGEKSSRVAAETLFDALSGEHAFVTGEMSDKEHLFDPSTQSKHLTGYDGENCCTFNLLKLARELYRWNWTDEAYRNRIVEYYERALYNHILGQQDPSTGMVCYFTPLQSGAYRLYSTAENSFWCCVGSGFESHVSYANFIYAHTDTDLFVNLLIPSTLDWDGTILTQSTDFPESGRTTLTIGGKSKKFTLRLRKPSWATSVSIKVNGKKTGNEINRMWKAGDKVEVVYGMKLCEEATTDDASRVALLYGPIVLAGELEEVDNPFSDPTQYNDYYTFDFKVPAGTEQRCTLKGVGDIKRRQGLTFESKSGITLRPFYDVHHKRYVVYWHKTK